jgi:flagellar FliJ protein
MTMGDDGALPLVIEIARKNRDTLARGAATARQLVDDNARQLAALEGYYSEYLTRHGRTPDSESLALRNFQAFIARLELAIDQQRITLEHHRGRALALKGEHTLAALRVKSLEALASARAAEAQRAVQRQERKQEDEHASRAARNPGRLGIAL